MATRNLLEKIEALPPEKREEVEDFVEFLATRVESGEARRPAAATDDDGMLRRMDERCERLRQQYGLYDSVATIRELRDSGE